MKIGGHVSIQGGLHKAAERAALIGAQAFALFCGSPRQWKRKDLTQQQVDQFQESLKKYKFSPLHILPHANYLINIATPEPVSILQYNLH
jgi:endonuclease IV